MAYERPRFEHAHCRDVTTFDTRAGTDAHALFLFFSLSRKRRATTERQIKLVITARIAQDATKRNRHREQSLVI